MKLKPVEAIQFDGSNVLEVNTFCEGVDNKLWEGEGRRFVIGKAGGQIELFKGSWLVKGERIPFNVNDDIVVYQPDRFPYTNQ